MFFLWGEGEFIRTRLFWIGQWYAVNSGLCYSCSNLIVVRYFITLYDKHNLCRNIVLFFFFWFLLFFFFSYLFLRKSNTRKVK